MKEFQLHYISGADSTSVVGCGPSHPYWLLKKGAGLIDVYKVGIPSLNFITVVYSGTLNLPSTDPGIVH